ncbi:cytochrome C [Geitlerinema sp. PCC 9228]|jgi:hypothetical protein|uniref:cytochrome C n=1 Tax=Geitlerinema sp. PCC 9228 TaxID=111611 RepID=UPI0008F9A268|nr:cytochrome C [Geitlerinema sp. PCC 9228]
MVRRKSRNPLWRPAKRSPFILLCLLVLWSGIIGWGIATASDPNPNPPSIGTVDPLPPRYQLGKELYIQNCGSCHLAIPPAVFPRQTWSDLLQDSQHYGTTITPLRNPNLTLVWNYLSTFSRSQNEEESTPYRFNQSRFFQALHPEVDIPNPTTVKSCVRCHPQAPEYNFRVLSSPPSPSETP